MKTDIHKQIVFDLIPFTFRVLFIWYLVAVLLELLFHGLVSEVLSLDLFLWVVILLAVFSFGIEYYQRSQSK